MHSAANTHQYFTTNLTKTVTNLTLYTIILNMYNIYTDVRSLQLLPSTPSTIPAECSALLAEMTQMWLARIIVFLRVGAIQGPLVVRVHHGVARLAHLAHIGPRISALPWFATITCEVSVYSVVPLIRRFLPRVHPFGTYTDIRTTVHC